jgi:hypothetical protein
MSHSSRSSSPRAILRSLAEETTFRGIVIYDVL